jgi:hypothetical protein
LTLFFAEIDFTMLVWLKYSSLSSLPRCRFTPQKESLAKMRGDNPARFKVDNKAAFDKCLSGQGKPKQCVKEGGRLGLSMVVDEGINYNGSQFVGIRNTGKPNQ